MGKKHEKVTSIFEEPCSLAETCAHVGEDCTDKGKHERESACYEEGENMGESSSAGGESVQVDGEISNEVGKQEESSVDATESIPETPETVSVGGHKTFTRTLHVSLSEEELAEKGAEMSRLIGVWTKAKLDKKAYDRASKKLIDDTEEKYVAIAEEVEAGEEEREVLCYTNYDPEHGLKRTYRCDTGALVEELNMELLDYEHCPEFQGEKSIENVQEAFQEAATDEAGGPEAGEPGEAQEEVANGGEKAAQEPNTEFGGEPWPGEAA